MLRSTIPKQMKNVSIGVWNHKISSIEKKYDVIVLAVSHNEFSSIDPKAHLQENGVVFDKGLLF